MKTRIIAAAVLLPLLMVVVLVLPAVWTAVLFGLLAAVAAFELLKGTSLVKKDRLVFYSMTMAVLVSFWSWMGAPEAWGILGVLAFLVILFAEMFASQAKLPFRDIALCVVAGILVPYLLTALVRLRSMEHGKLLILIPFVVAFLSDTGAYFVGCYLGKHKLAPVISPKKTVEGMIGGVLGAVLGMVLYCVVMQLIFRFRVNYLYAVLYGVVGSLAAVFGDLCFSAIKRQVGIKDYGNLIPGHGGVLDRFDSMTIVAPLCEALLLLLPVVVKV